MYGIKINGSWVTKDGKILEGRDAEQLRKTFPGAEVARLPMIRRVVDRTTNINAAYRASRSRTVIHRTTLIGGSGTDLRARLEKERDTIRGLFESPDNAEPLHVTRSIGSGMTVHYEVSS